MEIEKVHAPGMTSAQIIQIFRARGLRFSEATFRKYVQLGLLPRSRRVGSKGKHQGSHGLYPCATVRRINSIKGLMAQSYTIDQIQRRLGAFKQRVDSVESSLEDLFRCFEKEVQQPRFDIKRRRVLTRDVATARRSAAAVVQQIVRIEAELSEPEKARIVAGEGVFVER